MTAKFKNVLGWVLLVIGLGLAWYGLASANDYVFQNYEGKYLIEKTLQTVLQNFSKPQKAEMKVLTSYDNDEKTLKIFYFKGRKIYVT